MADVKATRGMLLNGSWQCDMSPSKRADHSDVAAGSARRPGNRDAGGPARVASVQRGDVWWARLEEETPVVVLSGTEAAELRAIRIVRPATAAEKQGFVVLSGEEAADVQARDRVIAASGPAIGGMGIEIEVGGAEGLPYAGVVRVALPREGRIFCTWLLTLTPDHLIRPIGSLSAVKLRHLDNALCLAAIE